MVQYQKRNKSVAALRENRTGIPTQLKKRVEDNTALGLDDVRVHYNSGKPAELDALAYTQGTQIYLGPGQERHLPHELGHVVQQKLGMVRPDTRHESGAMLNTDPALERQADRIGAGGGHYVLSPARGNGGQVAQRMSVVEGVEYEDDGEGHSRVAGLQIARYKRSGWRAVQQLGNFLTEDCMKEISVGQLEELSRAIQIMKPEEMYEKMESVTGGMGIVQYRQEFQRKFAEKLAAAKAAAGPLEAWNIIAGKLQAVLEQCSAAVGDMEEEMRAPLKIAELEKKGRYQRLGPVDPYFNCRKAALHCIARKASDIEEEYVGPHIALSIIGKKIYAAVNSHAVDRQRKLFSPKSDASLAERIHNAIISIEENDVSRYLATNTKFEGGDKSSELPPFEAILSYIRQLEGYTVLIVDAQEYRKTLPGELGPIHGEMAIMDYLQHNEDGQQIIADRGAKLSDVEGFRDGEMQRVIWIGGTKVDCSKCHQHFGDINISGSLGKNFVVSSKNVGIEYPGTQYGTHLAEKKKHKDIICTADRPKLEREKTEIVASYPADAGTQ